MLCEKDPIQADKFLQSYNFQLLETFSNATSKKNKCTKKSSSVYLPYLDSINVISKYLSNDSTSVFQELNNKNLRSSQNLQSTLARSEELQSYLRKQKNVMSNSMKTNPKSERYFKSIDQLNYYYGGTVSNRSEQFNTQMIQINKNDLYTQLIKQVDFEQYFLKHTQLEKFNAIQSWNVTDMKGAQSLLETQNMISTQIETLLSEGKNLIPNTLLGNGLNTSPINKKVNFADAPSFSPNQLKVKRTLDRMKFGINYQFVNFNDYYPNGFNLDFSVGYELKERVLSGIGFSHSANLGSSWNEVAFSTENYAVNAFSEYQFWKSLFVVLTYERTHFPSNEYLNTEIKFSVKDEKKVNLEWQNSLLIGIKVKQKIKGCNGNAVMSFQYDVPNSNKYSSAFPIQYKVGWEW